MIHQFVSFLGLLMLQRRGWLPVLVLAAFAPVYARGLSWFIAPPKPLQVRRLGLSELLYAVVFGLIFILGFHHQIGQ